MMIGNMDDVATLTDQLALMKDEQLPPLAQQYKNDAITLSLILNETKRRARVRNAAKAQPAQQPKVNDAVVASMQQQQLPEDVGIGALPAQNLQGMADGGIVGYADGGVAHYRVGGDTDSYKAYILQRAEAMGIDPAMALRLFGTESAFDPEAKSSAGAVGLGQLMPDTAKEMGLTKEQRKDPYKNIDASLGYFAKLQNKYKDTSKALAAYNWGQGNLDKHLAKNDGKLNTVGLPKETATYLTKILPMGSAQAEQAPAQKGAESDLVSQIPLSDRPGPAYIPQQKGVFGRLGDKMGLSEDTQRNLSNLNMAMAGTTGAAYFPNYLGKGEGIVSGLGKAGEWAAGKLGLMGERGLTAKQIQAMQAENAGLNALRAAQTAEEAAAVSGAMSGEARLAGQAAQAAQAAKAPRALSAAEQIARASEAAEVAAVNRAQALAAAGHAQKAANMFGPEDVAANPSIAAPGEAAAGSTGPLSGNAWSNTADITKPTKEEKKDAVDLAKMSLTKEERKGFSGEDLLEFGLRLMASKSPYFAQAAGEAGIGALASKRERDKIEREKSLQEAHETYYRGAGAKAQAEADYWSSGAKGIGTVMAQADKIFDNMMSNLSVMEKYEMTAEKRKALYDQALAQAYSAFKMTPPSGSGQPATTASQSDPLGLR